MTIVPTLKGCRVAGCALALTDSYSPSPLQGFPVSHLPILPRLCSNKVEKLAKFLSTPALYRMLFPLSGMLFGPYPPFAASCFSCPEDSATPLEAGLDIPYSHPLHQALLKAPSLSFPSNLMAQVLVSPSRLGPPSPLGLQLQGRERSQYPGQRPESLVPVEETKVIRAEQDSPEAPSFLLQLYFGSRIIPVSILGPHHTHPRCMVNISCS